MPLGLLMGIGRAFRRKRTSSLDILSSKRAPRNYYKGKNCKPTGFHTRKGGYVLMQEKLPNYVVPDLTDFKLILLKRTLFGICVLSALDALRLNGKVKLFTWSSV
ncbi:39S ribosomal protein L41-A, mitochondrial-like isoform X2 [Tripterygium wilfordii]|uniref:39S ribosomal protein L41-A, mitochondrial-like isoform X2 n=1 Tax=Tripterygium wilfordii TaxID=458696 RepID=UPI0018F83CDD|nr:39S ribosomal protein L41-A, mitochondrial-like isoform X2 [Tripterygium wilfordii]